MCDWRTRKVRSAVIPRKMLVLPIRDLGEQAELVAEVYRSHKEQGSLLKKVKLEIAVNGAFAERAIEAITEGTRTGERGGEATAFVFGPPLSVSIGAHLPLDKVMLAGVTPSSQKMQICR